MNNLKKKLKNLPMCPGVYIMKDIHGKVIYVGKSKLLKNRVSQYFMNSKNHTPKTVAMVENVADFDYIMTDTETEALVLECNLIKKYRPKYNILLKDDKQYPYIKITLNEEYPRIFMTRKIQKDGSKYFGPYMSAYAVKNTLEIIKKVFKIRSCTKNLPKDIGRGRPCLYYHIGQCSAPCANKISKTEYRESFDQISNVFEGKYESIISMLQKEMFIASDNLEFEKAGRYRDRIEEIKSLGEKQKIISTSENNRDIIGIYKSEYESCVQIFFMRDGKIQGTEYYVLEDNNSTHEEILSEFIKQYYYNATNIPKEILVSHKFDDHEFIETWLSSKISHKVSFLVPQRGKKAQLIKMVTKNAEESLKQHIFKRNREQMEQNDVLLELSSLLSLKNIPYKIEAYDISNISGTQSIGVGITYLNAKPSKKDYRKYNIKTVEGANDYESMREVIFRRINKAYEEEEAIKKGELEFDKAKFLPLPDLIFLDGGKGHVSAVNQLMDTLGEVIPVYGLVKDDKHRTRGITNEYEEYDIVINSVLFRFLFDIQEEVHRFAITAFRKKHQNASVYSLLEDIPGIGEIKRKKLLNTFISIENIKKASYEDLLIVLDKRAAENVYNYFHGGKINE